MLRWRVVREPGLIYNWIHPLCNLLGLSVSGISFYSWLLSGLWGYFSFFASCIWNHGRRHPSYQPLMCFPGPGHPPGILVGHDNWRAAPQSHYHGKACFCILMAFYISLFLNSKSCLQPVSLGSPFMFSLVNYTSAFLNSNSCLLPGALRLSLMFSVVNGVYMGDSGSKKSFVHPQV